MSFVTVDTALLKKEAQELLIGSPLWVQIQGGLVLNLHEVGASAHSLGDLVQNVIASVEVVKANIVKEQDPDGSLGLKFDGHLAFDCAVDLLHDAVRFGGVFGPILNAIDEPILKFIVEVGVAAWRGKDWLAVAKTLLALAV